MKINNYHEILKETLKYMQEMDIPKKDRRGFIKNNYGCLDRFMGRPQILKEETKKIYKKSKNDSNIKGKNASNALEESLGL